MPVLGGNLILKCLTNIINAHRNVNRVNICLIGFSVQI